MSLNLIKGRKYLKRNHRILYSIIGLIVILSSSTISLAMATDIKDNWAEDYIVQLIEKEQCLFILMVLLNLIIVLLEEIYKGSK